MSIGMGVVQSDAAVKLQLILWVQIAQLALQITNSKFLLVHSIRSVIRLHSGP